MGKAIKRRRNSSQRQSRQQLNQREQKQNKSEQNYDQQQQNQDQEQSSDYSKSYTKSNKNLKAISKASTSEDDQITQIQYKNLSKRLKNNNKPEEAIQSCKAVCFIFVVCIVVITLMFFISVAINCLVSHRNFSSAEKSNKISSQPVQQFSTQNTKQQIDQANKINKKIEEIEAKLKQHIQSQQVQIRKLKDQAGLLKLQEQIAAQQELMRVKKQRERKRLQQQKKLKQQSQQFSKRQNQKAQAIDQSQFQNKGQVQLTPQQKKVREQAQLELKQTEEEMMKKFKVRQQFRNNTPAVEKDDHYQFTVSIDEAVKGSSMSSMFKKPNSQWSGIGKAAYQRAMRLLDVVHNVNFKGEFVFDHYKFYKSPLEKYKTLSKLLIQEKIYYDRKYQTSKYIHDQIGMCVYVPSYNNAKTRLYLRNLDSIFQQDYKNYHIVYVNDASTDGTGDYAQKYMIQNQIPKQKYTIINNLQNKGNCGNIYLAAHSYCKDGQVMVLLDGDDALIGRQVFSLLNAVYQKEKVGLTYGQFLLIQNNKISSGFSRIIPNDNLKKGTFRQLKSFYTSHLKTVYTDVMRNIKHEDLKYQNGTYIGYASDVAYMTPAIELVGTRLKFLTELNYQYRFDTGLNQPHSKQIFVEGQVFKKAPSKKLDQMPFADNPKTIHYD